MLGLSPADHDVAVSVLVEAERMRFDERKAELEYLATSIANQIVPPVIKAMARKSRRR